MTPNLRLTYEGKQLEVDPSVRLTVGRNPNCDVVLQNRRVSATHASVHSDEGRWLYTDADSTNGSWLAGQRLAGSFRIEGSIVLQLGSPEEFSELGLATVTDAPPRVPEAAHPFLNQKRLNLAWLATGLLASLLVVGITDWAQFVEAATSVDDSLLIFVASYTFPLTLGIFLASTLMLYNHRNESTIGAIPMAVAVAAILVATGLAAAYFGLGRAPNFSFRSFGPPYLSLLLMAVQGYLNIYGWPLALSSVAIGTTAALQTDLWRVKARSTTQGLPRA